MFRSAGSRFTGSVWTNEHITAGGTVSEYAQEALLVPTASEQVRRVPRPALPIALLGVPFDNVTIPQAIERIEQMIASRQPHYVVTANVDFCVQAHEDVELRRILFDADLVLCDGTPLVWASWLFGNPLPERVAGADLVPLLLEHAAKKEYRVFFLGGASEVAERAIERLQAQYPDLVIAGHYAPPFRPLLDMNHEEISERIRAAQPDLLFVSFGCPKAEKWIAMHYRALGVPVCMGVGATIDFLAGRVRRAPGWMQRMGGEWVYRLAQEPRRLWRRYAKDLRQLGGPLVTQLWTQRLTRSRNGDGRAAITVFERTWVRVRMPARFDRNTLVEDGELWEQLGAQHCLLDLSGVEFIDSTALAELVQLHRRMQPCKLVLLAPSLAITRVLRRFQLESFFCIAADTIEARAIISPSATPAPENTAFSHPVPPLLWTGELTAVNADAVWNSTQKQLETLCQAGPAHATIDLAELRFIDSTGVGIMLRAKRYAQNLGARLRFLNAQPNVRNVLRLARLDVFLLQQ
jgi:N-acetylglucosaminyldiphosphoundecaprenol N-acetyl-beta-D-mannosaminyltransferase